jgi:histidine triad (HIT) family protein
MGCLFCNILEKKIPASVVYEDDHTLAFRDIRPVAPTHVLVIPKEHVSAIHALEPAHAATMGHLLVAARHVADQEGLTEKGFRLVINDGDAAGQTVHHIHVHVLGGRSLAWPPG